MIEKINSKKEGEVTESRGSSTPPVGPTIISLSLSLWLLLLNLWTHHLFQPH